MAHFEKTLNTETLFKGRVFTVTKDKVELENGQTSTREVVHHRGGACVAALTDTDEIYLVRQFRYAFGEELWELPAGKLEAGEEPFATAQRELEEECGLRAQHYLDLGAIYPTVGYCSEVIYSWLATGLAPCEMHPDEGEFLTVFKIPFENALAMVMNGEIKDSKTVAALLKIKYLKEIGRI